MLDTVYARRLQGRNIRVIELFPGEPEDQLICRLVEVSLDDPPSYEALSYVWGDANVRQAILCNGSIAQITVSLAQALHWLRLPNAPRILWADAICMNQDDMIERNHQVQLMGQVYSTAAKVIV